MIFNIHLLKNEKMALEYSNMVTQRYNELNNVKECNLEPSKSYENVIIANKEVSKTLLPKETDILMPNSTCRYCRTSQSGECF